MSQPEAVFVFPRFQDFSKRYIGTHAHVGTAYIRAYLADHGVHTEQFISPAARRLEENVEEILAYGAPVVGFTCYDRSFYLSKVFSEALKKANPEIKIVWGGPTVTSEDQLIMRECEAVDVCVRFEGEETMRDLLEQWGAGRSESSVAGITYRENGDLRRTEDRASIGEGERGSELDVLSSPYLTGMMPVVPQVTPLLTSRGCPFLCTFCDNSLMGRRKVRYHSVDHVIEELRYINSSGATQSATFVDDAFTLNTRRAREICRRIIDEDLRKISYACQTRIDKADEELFSLFVEAGFNEIAFGLESAQPRLLNLIKKVRSQDGADDDYKAERNYLEQFRENVAMAKEKGLLVCVSTIFGLPTETREDAQSTLDFVKELDVQYYTHNVLQVFTGTEMEQSARNYGIEVKPSPFLLPYSVKHHYNAFSIPHLPHSLHLATSALEAKAINNDYLVLLRARHQAGNETIGHVALYGGPSPSDNVIRWLVENSHMDTCVFLMADCETLNQPEQLGRAFKKFADRNAPISNYNHVVREDPAVDDLRTERHGVFSLNRLQSILLVPGQYRQYTRMPYRLASETPEENPGLRVRYLENAEDVQAMLEDIEHIAMATAIDLTEFLSSYFVLEESCRWSCSACPALEGNVVTIDREERIFTCHHNCVGSIETTSPQDIRQKMQERVDEARARRGCDQCPVNSSCSKCPSLPEFMSEAEYCEIRREYPRLHHLISSMTVAFHLYGQMRSGKIPQEPRNEVEVSGIHGLFFVDDPFHSSEEKAMNASVLKPELMLVRIHGQYFIFDDKQAKLMRINGKMAAVFEYSAEGCGSQAPAQLARLFSMSEQDAEELIAQALQLYARMGMTQSLEGLG